MVGAAQYRDDEIDWVLSAVVNKKKQSYIQTKFKDKFGRGLNHNQIRYIKNKYGKDPRFNSPLVNVRAPKSAASPPESVLGTAEYDEEDDIGSPTVAGPSTQRTREGHDIHRLSHLRTPSKRKRSIQDEGDSFESLLQHSAKTQRLNPPAHTSMPQLMADTPSRWNPMAAQSAAYTLSPAAAATPSAAVETLYAGAYDTGQQPLQGTSGISWTPSMSMGGSSSVWDFGASPSLINTGGNPAATLMQNVTSSSPANFNYYAHQTPASYAFPSPVATRHQHHQLPQPHHTSMPPPRFSPAMPHLICSPYPQGQQQQQQQEQTQAYNTNQGFSNNQAPAEPNATSNPPHASPEHTPTGAHHPVPSFEQVPIEDASWDNHDNNNNTTNTPRSSTPAPGTAQDWTRITYAPYEPSPFDPIPPPMEFPFETVRYTGLTATSARVMYKALREEVENQRRTDQVASDNNSNSNNNTVSPVVSSLEMLNMVRQPTSTSNAAAHHHQHPQTSSSSTVPSYYQRTHDHNAEVDLLGTIDPRLLIEQHPSPPTAHHGGQSYGVSPPPDLPDPK